MFRLIMIHSHNNLFWPTNWWTIFASSYFTESTIIQHLISNSNPGGDETAVKEASLSNKRKKKKKALYMRSHQNARPKGSLVCDKPTLLTQFLDPQKGQGQNKANHLFFRLLEPVWDTVLEYLQQNLTNMQNRPLVESKSHSSHSFLRT